MLFRSKHPIKVFKFYINYWHLRPLYNAVISKYVDKFNLSLLVTISFTLSAAHFFLTPLPTLFSGFFPDSGTSLHYWDERTRLLYIKSNLPNK